MSNMKVWTSIACSLPRRQHSQGRASPLLQLFNGYAKSQSTRTFAQWSIEALSNTRRYRYDKRRDLTALSRPATAAFSTPSCLAARPNGQTSRKKVANLRPAAAPPRQTKADTVKAAAATSDAKLEPAPTTASHTEGVEREPLTWRDYDPEGGMPLPGGERSQSEINAIFNGRDVDVDTGNYILSVMHWRRMSGALIDVGLDFPSESGVTREQALLGLEFVRSQLPNVDEADNGSQWAQEEEQRLREELAARAVKLGLYKPTSEDLAKEEYEEELEMSDQGTEAGRSRSGESVLQANVKANKAAHEKFKREREAANEKATANALASARGPLELAGGVQRDVSNLNLTTQAPYKGPFGITIRPPPSQAFLDKPREKAQWIKYYEDQAMIIKDNATPQISTLARLGPAFLVFLSVLVGCWFLHQNYTPPPTSARLWPETPPAIATLWAITGLLVATFCLGRIPQLYRSYSKYGACVPAYPYAFSIIGCMFRHDKVVHLASNLLTLWLFGVFLHEDVGRGTFLAIYLASGVTGSYSALLYNVLRKQWMVYVFGSSGSVLGVTAAACTLRPTGSITVFGYTVPVYAWMYLAFIGVMEVTAAIKAAKTTIDHAGHVGGIIAGGASALALRYQNAAAQNKPTEGGDGSTGQMMKRDLKEVADELKREAKAAL